MMCARLMVALWMLAGVSVAAAAASYPTVVVLGTVKGRGHPALPAPIEYEGQWQLMRDLMPMLGSDDVASLAYLAKPTACGEVMRADCTELSITTDEKLLEAIGQFNAPQVLVIRPMAGVWAKHQVYYARLEVTLLEAKPPYARLRSFLLSYRESECDRACTAVAHRYAAQEFRDMITYMLSLQLGSRPKAPPPSWQDKPKLKDVSRWANSCLQGGRRDRLVRDDRDRAWVGRTAETGSPDISLTLSSLSWTGCT